MSELLHQLIESTVTVSPDAVALVHKKNSFNYRELQQHISLAAAGFNQLHLGAGDRIAVYLPKLPETVFSLFAASASGNTFVPINPLLKANQVAYILNDCNVKVLVTSAQRYKQLAPTLADCVDLITVVVIEDQRQDQSAQQNTQRNHNLISWSQLTTAQKSAPLNNRIDADMAAILYTSGSTGNPKGVVLSHKNLVTGAKSVASYLQNTADDKLLAVLPFSFDYGLSQLTTAFSVGASVVLMDYLLPRDILRSIVKHQITGLAAVPPLWNQLTQLEWPEACAQNLRYLTNSGGAMPKAMTSKLQATLPNTDLYLMYGLTEAFRSTYLTPDQVTIRPESMGKAIPNAEVMVVREDGSECAADEPGELVHRGSLVAMGYWNDPDKTAERFKPAPGQLAEIPVTEIAVWSGDQVRKDSEGYLYFISRKDDMIKTSGYRVSPTEVEEVIYNLDTVKEVAALGLPHPALGQAILLVVSRAGEITEQEIVSHCQKELPNFMLPHAIRFCDQLPKNQNGKIDRKRLTTEYHDLFLEIKQ